MNTNHRLTVLAICLTMAAAAAGPAAAARKPPPPATASTAEIAYFSYSVSNAGGEVNSQEDIFTVDPKTQTIKRLTDDRNRTFISDRDPAWSPDRTKIALFRSDGTTTRLVVIDARTGRTLNEYPTTVGLAPEWLSGTQIVAGNGVWDRSDLVVQTYPSGAQVQLTAAAPGESFVSPSWDPVKGLAVTRVTMQYVPPADAESDGYWDPTGAYVLTFTPEQVTSALATGVPLTSGMGTDVTGPRGLTWSWEPSWSPTENKLVVSSNDWTWSWPGTDENGNPTTYTGMMSEIVLVDLTEPGYTRVTTDAGEAVTGSDGSPVFSPDGIKIAWARGLEDEWREIVVLNTADAGTSTTPTVVGNERQARFKGALDW